MAIPQRTKPLHLVIERLESGRSLGWRIAGIALVIVPPVLFVAIMVVELI